MNLLFNPLKIGSMEIKNRLARSATWEGMADRHGFVSTKYINLYDKLASGGAGLIFTGFLFVSLEGRGPKGMAGISSEQHIDRLRKMTNLVHQKDSKVIAQLAHCGRRVPALHRPAIVSPAINGDNVLTHENIKKIISDFIAAITRAQQAGFDGVQLHCAHGYLLSDFLSPHTNSRTDDWGGSPERNFAIIKEIVNKAREKVGPEYPIMLKINGSDNVAGGVTPDLCINYVKQALQVGISAVEISGGVPESGSTTIRGDIPLIMLTSGKTDLSSVQKAQKQLEQIKDISAFKYNYNLENASLVKKAVPGMTIISVGGHRILRDMEDILNNGLADVIALCRPFIIEPDLPLKFKEGKSKRSRCLNCNLCLPYTPVLGVRCYYGKEPSQL